MIIINVANVSKTYGGIHHVLEDAALAIQRGRKIGMVGPNGAGKSTLFKMIAGLEEPDSGAVWRMPGLTVGYLAQEPVFPAHKSVFEVAMQASGEVARYDAELRRLEQRMGDEEVYSDGAKLERVMAEHERVMRLYQEHGGLNYRNRVEGTLRAFGFSEEWFEQPVGTLSGGQRKLLGLTQLFVRQPDVLLLDEPDNHLDMLGKRELERLINEYPGTVVVISHDRYLLDVVAEEIAEVIDHKCRLWPGNYSQFQFDKHQEQMQQLKQFDMQQREIRRMETSIRRLISWSSGGQNEKMIKRARNMQKRLDKIERVERPRIETRTMGLELRGTRGSDKALELIGVWKVFHDNGQEKEVLTEANLLVWGRERVGLVGPNGAGKSVLFKLILGEMQPTAGAIKIGPSNKIAYYAQEHQTLDYDLTPVEEVRKLKAMYEEQAYGFLGRFLFGKNEAQKPVRALSGGEKARLQFAKLMLTDANLLLLDEPTNNLDIPSCEALEEVIENYGGTVVVISHDRYFLETVADRIVEIQDGELVSYDGGWEYYERKKREAGEPLGGGGKVRARTMRVS
ncbi:MAG TPA: ABC-F family ATP-binding cassette domain-containing protein [Ardenticatenaceae bacterium]|nr:ABC-F family ATP-binding cassette domain-containing protein [Ardenticatenaceae bacterium]